MIYSNCAAAGVGVVRAGALESIIGAGRLPDNYNAPITSLQVSITAILAQHRVLQAVYAYLFAYRYSWYARANIIGATGCKGNYSQQRKPLIYSRKSLCQTYGRGGRRPLFVAVCGSV